MVAILFALLQAAAPVGGSQVSIDNAANGGLRDWQPVAGKPGELYVRDRTDRWYRVRLSGPCERYRRFDALNYTTGVTGSFDRFSTVQFIGAGPITCSVESIVRSGVPPQLKSPRSR